MLLGRRSDVPVMDAVDPEGGRACGGLLRLQVDVGRPVAKALGDDDVHDADDRRLLVDALQPGPVVLTSTPARCDETRGRARRRGACTLVGAAGIASWIYLSARGRRRGASTRLPASGPWQPR